MYCFIQVNKCNQSYEIDQSIQTAMQRKVTIAINNSRGNYLELSWTNFNQQHSLVMSTFRDRLEWTWELKKVGASCAYKCWMSAAEHILGQLVKNKYFHQNGVVPSLLPVRWVIRFEKVPKCNINSSICENQSAGDNAVKQPMINIHN